MSGHRMTTRIVVNGEAVEREVPVRRHLVDFLREDLGLTGSHLGCEHGVCGACTVRVNGEIVRGCLVLAASLDGAQVETVEGLSDGGTVADLQEAFVARNAALSHLDGARYVEAELARDAAARLLARTVSLSPVWYS